MKFKGQEWTTGSRMPELKIALEHPPGKDGLLPWRIKVLFQPVRITFPMARPTAEFLRKHGAQSANPPSRGRWRDALNPDAVHESPAKPPQPVTL